MVKIKKNYLLYILILIYACNDSNAKKEKRNELITNTGVTFFSPNTIYKTPVINYDFVKAEQKPYYEPWEKAGYIIFDNVILDSTNHEQFELVNIFNTENHIVLFNETKIIGDSIEHTILDTLYNFDAFTDSLENIGTSIGILSKTELIGIKVDSINANSIVAITQDNSGTTLTTKIDSAIKSKKRNSFNPIKIENKAAVLKAWFANTKTKKFEIIK
jgi:hypothetical protein